MARLCYPDLIVESVAYLYHLVRTTRGRQNSARVRFLWHLKTGQARTLSEAGTFIGLQARQSAHLWQRYRTGGLESLWVKTTIRNWGKLSSVQISRLLQYLDSDEVKTQQEIIAYLETEMGVHYTQAGVCVLLKRLKVKLKTGRPSNIRKEEGSEDAFKKKCLTS